MADLIPHPTSAVEALDTVKENCRIAYRSAEMSAEIMRDARRTGGWEGSERTARAFDRIAKNAKAAHDGLSDLSAALERAPAGEDDPACTDCGGSGVSHQTERRCACAPAVGPSREAIARRIKEIVDFTIADARLHDNLEDLSAESVSGLLALLPQAQDDSIVRAPSFTGLADGRPIETKEGGAS